MAKIPKVVVVGLVSSELDVAEVTLVVVGAVILEASVDQIAVAGNVAVQFLKMSCWSRI